MEKIIVLLFMVYVSIGAIIATTCTYDYQCNVPYAYCENRISIFQGIVVDKTRPNHIFLTGRYISGNGPFGNASLFDFDTSIPSNSIQQGNNYQQVFRFTGESFDRFLYKKVNSLVDMVNGNPIVQLVQFKSNPTTSLYNRQSLAFQNLYTAATSFQGVIFDQSNDILYRCATGYLISTTKPFATDQSQQVTTQVYSIFNGERDCYTLQSLSDSNPYLYFTTRDSEKVGDVYITKTLFHRGVKSCKGCSSGPSNSSTFLFQESFSTLAVTISPQHFYYSSDTTLYQVPLSGDLSQRRVITQDNWIGSLAFDANTQTLYYTTTDNVKMVKNLGANQQPVVSILYSPSPYDYGDKYLKSSNCQCNQGFQTVDNQQQCANCNGTVRWNNGYPTCDPFLPDGSVSFCNQDSDCLNSPYTYCYFNSCHCRYNFTGNRCQYCQSGNIEWNEGIPTCK